MYSDCCDPIDCRLTRIAVRSFLTCVQCDNTPRRPWWFPEHQPVGVVLGTPQAVSHYDANQGTCAERDNRLLDRLGVGPRTQLVDFACGTGSFVLEAARRGASAHGVDVSTHMIDFARTKAAEQDLHVEWHRNGFLDYRHAGDPADVVTTKSALHQLPDMWKQLALNNMAATLRTGGTFYLWDVAFSFDPAETDIALDRWIHEMGGTGFSVDDFTTHVREEFSTWTWILEGLVERAGLTIESARTPSPTYVELVCRKD